jgi:hypothetical protein
MEIRIAITHDTKRICSFFSKHLSKKNDALYSDEFFCSMGVRAAIKRGQMIIAVEGKIIAGVARFYRKKKTQQISLYQFAVDSKHRGTGLLLNMLEQLRVPDIVVLCPKESTFNNYYNKTGWILMDQIGEFNQWRLKRKYLLP